MQKEPEIVFRDIEKSDAVRDKIEDRIERLERYSDDLIGCRVVVETPHRHKHKGKIYKVSVEVTVPGDEIVANRHPEDDHSHEDVFVAVKDAFKAAERQLKEWAERRRGEVKKHDSLPRGTVSRLEPDEDHGFITPRLGSGHVYFHRNALVGGDFEELDVGTPVEYHEEEGEKGPQASTVHVVGEQGTVPGKGGG